MGIAKDLQKNRIRCLIAIFVFVITVFLFIAISPDRISGDFDVYYHAGRQFLARTPLYTPHGGIEEFKYLPLFAFAFSPLSSFKEIPALWVWSLLNIFLFYFMFYFLYRLKLISFSALKDFLIIVCLFALIGRYIFADIKLGQTNTLLCFLMVLTMYLEINQKDFWSGCVLALSLMIKFFPLLFLFYFILTKRFRIVAYTFLMAVFFLLLPAIYSGFDLNLRYLQEWCALLKSSPALLFYSVKNYSILSYFSWFFIARHDIYYIFDYDLITKKLTPEVYYWWMGSCLVVLGSFFYDTFFVKGKDLTIKYLDYSGLFVCGLLINPLVYLNTLIFLSVPYLFILRFLFYPEGGRKYVFTVGFLVLLGFMLLMVDNKVFFKDKWVFYAVLESRPLMGTVILAYVSLWLIKLSQYSSKPAKKP